MTTVMTPPETQPASHLLEVRIELARIKPTIWRTVLLPETITLPKLHKVIQAVMGWEDYHLHAFEIAGERYGVPDPDFDFGPSVRNEQRVRLLRALKGTKTLRYTYDFGDDWEHLIKIERRHPPDPVSTTPRCIGGANANPPEDVGGEPGYAHFVEAIADPFHPEHSDMLAWHGSAFDPSAFDLAAINRRLQSIRF